MRDADDRLARALALDFARQALRDAHEVLGPALTEVSLGYLDAAASFADSGDAAGVRAAHERYFAARDGLGRLPREISWIAGIAVLAHSRRAMEQAGIIARSAFVPTVLDVAREAQKAAGAVAGAGSGGRDAAGRARWECARRQLLLAVAAAPFPGEAG